MFTLSEENYLKAIFHLEMMSVLALAPMLLQVNWKQRLHRLRIW